MTTKTQKPVLPLYATAAVWVLYTLFFPLYQVIHFLFVGLLSLLVYAIVRHFCGTVEVDVEETPTQEPSTGNEALDKMLHDGKLALSELRRLDASIADDSLSANIRKLTEISEKIFAQVRSHPEQLPQIRKFMDYYLPTTLKILNAYDRMDAQGIRGENIDTTLERVENMISTIVTAFEKQLDTLFRAEAMDISSDITVLENLLTQEGWTVQDFSSKPQ